MYKNKTFLAIIPARAGSKGLPGKNIKMICKKPLIAWSIQKARLSKFLDEVIVSTEDETIAKIAREWGANVPFLRPRELATDTASSYDVIAHAVEFFQKRGKNFDFVVLLEPTSPLREDDDIDNMIQKLIDSSSQSIISVGEVKEHPSLVMRLQKNRVDRFCKDIVIENQRQKQEKAYFPYGVAYIAKTDILLQKRSFYFDNVNYYVIKRYQCYEIDDIYDFLAVETIMRYEWGKE